MKKCLIVLLAVAPIVGFTQTVYTAKKGAITDGSKIVTNVTFEGLATVADLAPVAVVATNSYDTATNALEVAQTAYNRPSITTNAVNDLAGALVSNHNASTVSHSDIRASVSNAVDLASGAVKTNSVGGLAVGELSTAGYFSIAYGYATDASGSFSQAFGFTSKASGLYSFASGYQSQASSDYAFAIGQSISSGIYGFSSGNQSISSGEGSFSAGWVANATNDYSFCWSGSPPEYYSHGDSTFNINPVGGPSGFYIGETNLQTLLDEKLSAEHENESSAHSGRITALENRPTGLTTNTPFPFIILIDTYSTNGVVRMAVSNGTFQIWGQK